MYIQGIGVVSAWDGTGAKPHIKDDHFAVVDPDYKKWIDLQQIRRMSRIIKMGVAAAHQSLEEADIPMPGDIITGTAWGCLADTAVFLQKMVQQHEEMLTPTAFIQSTHNTLAGQIAVKLGCHGYNNTFVHGSFSFEHALLDAEFQLLEDKFKTILVGAADEITSYSHHILKRFGLYKNEAIASEKLLNSKSKGTIAGEGAVFFVMQQQKNEHSLAKLMGVEMVFRPGDKNQIPEKIEQFLASHGLSASDLDLLVSGRNGDIRTDKIYEPAENGIFKDVSQAAFKHLSGEYPTSMAFGAGLAARAISKQILPSEALFQNKMPGSLNHVLIWNAHPNLQHSFILLQKC